MVMRAGVEADVEVSVVVNAHAEGRLVHHTVASVERARAEAGRHGIVTELVAVLDNPTDDTRAYFERRRAAFDQVVEVAVADVGQARNAGVAVARGRYTAFVDGDNLMARDWLHRAWQLVRGRADRVVAHPELLCFFGAEKTLWRQVSQDDPAFSLADLLEANCWDAIAFAETQVFRDVPYAPVSRAEGFGYEDWHWNCQTIASGIQHRVVPETAAFLRRKEVGSLYLEDQAAGAVLPATDLFAPALLRALVPDADRPRSLLGASISAASLKTATVRASSAARQAVKRMLRSTPRVQALVKQAYHSARRGLSRTAPGKLRFPGWLLERWRELHEVEPQLYPDRQTLDGYEPYRVPPSRLLPSYLELMDALQEEVTHVFLVPWLGVGGADLTALRYVHALAGLGGAGGLVVCATEPAPSEWAGRLPPGVRFVPLGVRTTHLGEDERATLLLRALVQAAPPRIHNVNSRLGHRLFAGHSRALSRSSRLYATVFCADVTPEGRRAGYGLDVVPGCFDDLAAVSADHRAFLDELETTFDLDGSRLFAHYQPVTPGGLRARRGRGADPDQVLSVLWAGRLDRQKRPDLVRAIALHARELPVRFDVYGTSVLMDGAGEGLLRGLPNLTFHGPYEAFDRLPLERFDLLLYTAQWDGLPNVLLEAMAHGVPVVAPALAGIRELVTDGQTGYLIDRFDDVPAYADLLARLARDSSPLEAIAERALELVCARHTEEAFLQQVRAFPGYLDA